MSNPPSHEAKSRLVHRERPAPDAIAEAVKRLNIHPLLVELALMRNLDPALLWPSARDLPDPRLLPDVDVALERVVRAVKDHEVIAGVFDHDADGCTSGAVLYHAMTDHFGVLPQHLHIITSHKIKEGYGLSAKVADRILALQPRPALVITADQGSSDEEQIRRLREHGIETVVTDHHHVPVEGPPASAVATVNPSRLDSAYPDKAIAGVGVMWLFMSLLRNRMAERNLVPNLPRNLRHLLDFVAVGTVADAASLASPVNRWFVQEGIQLMQERRRPCWRVMPQINDAMLRGGLTASDIGFNIAPRINAQGRMDDACEGIRFLTARDDTTARTLLAQLEHNNKARRELESSLVACAIEIAEEAVVAGRAGLTVYLPDGSPSVHGIVASRIVDRYHRPTICLSPMPGVPGMLTGSIRSVEGFHVRLALDEIDQAHPGLLLGFGGHAAAAGLKLQESNWAALAEAWDETVRKAQLSPERLVPVDLELETPPTVDLARQLLTLEPLGRGFENPLFLATVEVEAVNVFKDVHLGLTVKWPDRNETLKAVWFNKAARFHAMAPAFNPSRPKLLVSICFELSLSSFRNQVRCDLIIRDVIAVNRSTTSNLDPVVQDDGWGKQLHGNLAAAFAKW